MKSLSCVRLLATSWTEAHQAPLSMGFSRQEYWSGVPLPSLMYPFRTSLIKFTDDKILVSSVQFSSVAQSCPTLRDPVDCSPPGSSAHEILQARTLEWVAISFSRGIFPTQGSNPCLPHCRQILYHLSQQGSLQYHVL